MTKKEYSDLKYKIVTRKNVHLVILIPIVLGFCFVAVSFIAFQMKVPFEFGLAGVLWMGLFMLIIATNPWNKKLQKLDELFKSKFSYEEAEKELGLRYEPPKNWKVYYVW